MSKRHRRPKHHKHETVKTEQVPIDDLQVLVSTALSVLTDWATQLDDLVDSRQRGLGFLTPLGRVARDQYIRTERRARVDTSHPNIGRDIGLAYMRRSSTEVPVPGEHPAPVNMPVTSLLAEARFVLLDRIREITKAMTKAGVCPLYRMPLDPDLDELISYLRRLTWHTTNRRLLEHTHRDIERLNEQADRVVDGNDQDQLDDPCPNCGRHTLVVTFRNLTITCDRDKHTGHFERCECNDPLCVCHNDLKYRHQWHQLTKNRADSWDNLRFRLKVAREAATQDATP